MHTMDLPWYAFLASKYQPKYSSVIEWKYYQILGKHTYSIIFNFIKKYTDEEEYESVHKCVLDEFVKQHLKLSNLG